MQYQTRNRVGFLTLGSFSIALALSLSACGEGETGNNTSATLSVVSSDPVNLSTKVGIDKTMSITFADALDPTTVTSANVMLMPGNSSMPEMDNMDDMGNMDHSSSMTDMGNMSIIPGQPTCQMDSNNECKTIIFRPSMSLEYGQQYHIMVHGLKTKSGRIFTGEHVVPLEFTTAFSVVTESENNLHDPSRYRKTETQYAAGGYGQPPTRISRTSTNSSGVTQLTRYNVSVGSSGRIADVTYSDQFGQTISRYTYSLVEAGRRVATVVYNDPGPNMAWGDSDDLISGFIARGEDHGAHRLTTSYRVAQGAPGVSIPALSLSALKANPSFSVVGANLAFYENISSGQPRLKKAIRFRNFGDNGIMDIDMNGNKTLVFDDDIREYQVYEFDPIHQTRIGRKEFEAPEGTAGLSFNEIQDEQQGYLSGYRIYRTAQTTAAGNAIGMLRVAEVTYSAAGPDGKWYNSDGFSPNAEEDNSIRDYELSFYCRDPNAGLYEKYEVEIGPGVDGKLGNGFSTINVLLNNLEPRLFDHCQDIKPNLITLGLGDDVLRDADRSQIF